MALGTRNARIRITVDPELDRGLSIAKSKMSAFGRASTKTFGTLAKAVPGAARALGRMGAVAGGGLVAGGIAAFASQVGDVLDYERGIVRLQIAQQKTSAEMQVFRDRITEVSQATGIGRNELVAGAASYQALTGDTRGATAAIKTFARVAQATGSTVSDVATAGASLSQTLKIDPRELEKAFSVLNVQGREGAIELNEFAREVAGLSADFQSFAGGRGVAGMTEMGASLQIVRRNFGSASEAATGMMRLMQAFGMNRNVKKLAKAGIQVFDAKGEKRNFVEIMSDIRNAGIHETDLGAMLGSSEAIRASKALLGNWEDFQGLVKTTDFRSIERDLETYALSPAGKMEAAANNIKIALAEAFTPERIKMFATVMQGAVPIIEKVLEKANRFIEWVDRERKRDTREKELGSREHDLTNRKVTARYKEKLVYEPGSLIPKIVRELDVDAMTKAGSDLARFEASLAAQQGRDAGLPGQMLNILGVPSAMIPTTPEAGTTASAAELTGRAIGIEISKQLARLVSPRLALVIDGNEVVTASANAGDARRSPGGS